MEKPTTQDSNTPNFYALVPESDHRGLMDISEYVCRNRIYYLQIYNLYIIDLAQTNHRNSN